MFQKKNQQEGLKQATINILGAGTQINGDLLTAGDIRIDGKIAGNVSSDAKVVLGETGEVTGNIVSQSAEIAGTINGDVVIKENLFIKATAKVNGNISSDKLVIENGADFNGFCKMGSEEDKQPKFLMHGTK